MVRSSASCTTREHVQCSGCMFCSTWGSHLQANTRQQPALFSLPPAPPPRYPRPALMWPHPAAAPRAAAPAPVQSLSSASARRCSAKRGDGGEEGTWFRELCIAEGQDNKERLPQPVKGRQLEAGAERPMPSGLVTLPMPHLSCTPRSPTSVSYPSGRAVMKSWALASLQAVQSIVARMGYAATAAAPPFGTSVWHQLPAVGLSLPVQYPPSHPHRAACSTSSCEGTSSGGTPSSSSIP